MPPQHHDFGKYKLLRRIASGGMGEVHLAKLIGPSGFEKLVVIKRLLQSRQSEQKYIDMFFLEARVAAQLGHSNIVQIYEVGTIDETPYIAMEYVHGKSLRKVMDTALKRPTTLGKEGLPPGFTAYIISQLCAGLAFAHDARHLSGATIGLVHRDINPHNVLISYQGEVKIIDFGIAKSELNMDQTQAGTIKGTVVYMSPEQSMGEKLDKRSDLFSVGICLYEALTGSNPFHKSGMGASLQAIRDAEVPPLAQDRPYLQPFAPILSQALARRREQRFDDCGEMGERLQQLIESGQVARPPVPLGSYMAELFAQEMLDEERVLERTDTVRNPLLASGVQQFTRPIVRAPAQAASALDADGDARTKSDAHKAAGADSQLGSDRTVSVPMDMLFGRPTAKAAPASHTPSPADTPLPILALLRPLGPAAKQAQIRARQWLSHPTIRAYWPYLSSFAMMFALVGAIVVVARPRLATRIAADTGQAQQLALAAQGSPTSPTSAAPGANGASTSSTAAGVDSGPSGTLRIANSSPAAGAAPVKISREPVATLAIDEDAYVGEGPEPREALARQNQEHRVGPRRRGRDTEASLGPALQIVAQPPLAVQYEGHMLADGGCVLHGSSGTLQLGQNPDADPFIVTLRYRTTARGVSFQIASMPWANVSGPGGIDLGRTPLDWTEPSSTLSLEFKNPHVDTAQRVTLRLGPQPGGRP